MVLVWAFGSFLFFCAFLLLVYIYSFEITRFFIFLRSVERHRRNDIEKRMKWKVKGCKNFYLTVSDNTRIGVWHILPQSVANEEKITLELFEKSLGYGKSIIVYAHGNSGTRASDNRVQLYKTFQTNDFHVIAFDYRGFADSSELIPDQSTAVEDMLTVLKWVFKRKRSSRVFVWGHSLGTAISAEAVANFEKAGHRINGLILEAPFNNMEDAVKNFPVFIPFRYIIGFENPLIKRIMKNNIQFKTDEYLSNSTVPVLILHAQDDRIIPSFLGKRLHEHLVKNRPADLGKNVKHVEFSSKRRKYGHVFIYKDPTLMSLIKLFMEGKYEEVDSCGSSD